MIRYLYFQFPLKDVLEEGSIILFLNEPFKKLYF